MTNIPKLFRDANYRMVEYDGSKVEWRISIYGLLIQQKKILLVKHQDETFWDFPGGGVEMGEELAETLLREGQEEAGWNLTPIQPISTHSDWFYHTGEKKFYRSIQFFWSASGKEIGSPTEKKIEQVQCVSYDQLDDFPINANGLEALHRALDLKILNF